jgi:CDP-diacylglycerol--glycerol-3-phosphate 3-phosphatidyltransferase
MSVLFIRLNASPNFLSILGLLSGIAVGWFFYVGRPIPAAIFIFLCGVFDVLDGKVAIRTNKKSLFGAIFDSTLDRYSEFFIYLGLAVHFRSHWTLWVIFFTFLGSTMVSYTRARAEGLGFDCGVGIMQRAERIVLLFFGATIGAAFDVLDPAMTIVLLLIAVVSNITALQRTFYVRKAEKQKRAQ